MLEERNKELKQEGADFKTTILAAQKFSDNLREATEAEARNLMEEARVEVEKFRKEAESELSRLPAEIEELSRRKKKVREDLKTTLLSYLDSLDIFPDSGVGEEEDENSDLFQSIQLPDEETIDFEDLDKITRDLS